MCTWNTGPTNCHQLGRSYCYRKCWRILKQTDTLVRLWPMKSWFIANKTFVVVVMINRKLQICNKCLYTDVSYLDLNSATSVVKKRSETTIIILFHMRQSSFQFVSFFRLQQSGFNRLHVFTYQQGGIRMRRIWIWCPLQYMQDSVNLGPRQTQDLEGRESASSPNMYFHIRQSRNLKWIFCSN